METKKKKGSVLGGLIIFVIGIVILWWNEGRTVKQEAAIGEFKDSYVEIDSSKIDTNNDGKAIYTYGNLTYSEEGSTDSEFNVNVKGLVLSRKVEMYQWKEECESDNDGYETCNYTSDWSDDYIDSSDYDSSHKNPEFKYKSERFYANDIKLGAFTIEDFYEYFDASKQFTDLSEEVATSHSMRIDGNMYTTQEEDKSPVVGDLRITFTYGDATSASVIGSQNKEELEFYRASNSYTVGRLNEGNTSAIDLIQQEIDANNLLKWALRILGTVLVICGLLGVISPLQRLASVVPVLGKIVNSLSSAIAFAVGLCISLLVIAIAWFRFRPVLSIILIVIGVAVVILAKKFKSKKVETKEENKPEITTEN